MKSTFRILFYAKWEASDEAKMLPIYVRITINGTKARFSLKIRVSEKIWDAKSGRAIGHSHEAHLADRTPQPRLAITTRHTDLNNLFVTFFCLVNSLL